MGALTPQQILSQQQVLQAQANLMAMGSDVIKKDSTDIRTYFARYDGAKYYFSDGGVATFVGGEYSIDAANPDNSLRVKELEYVVDVNAPIFSRTKCILIRSEGKVLREVNMRNGGVDPNAQMQSSVGMLGSVEAAAMSARS